MAAARVPRDAARRALFGLLLLAGGMGLFSGCGDKGRPGSAGVERPAVTGVEVVAAAPAQKERFGEAVGTVRSRNVAAVASHVMGRVTAVHVSEGSRVGKGALLCTIDDAALRAQAASAEGMVAEAESAREEAEWAIAQAEAGKALAEKTYARYRTLRDEKVVTQQEFEEAEAKRTVAVKDYERALERRAQAQARLAQARGQRSAADAMLSHTRVTAPFAGVVTEKRVDAGSMAVPGVPLLVLEDTNRYRLEASVAETHLLRLSPGSPVQVAVDSAPGKWMPAVVSERVATVDPSSRTFVVKAELPGPGLRSGMSGRLRFPIGKASVLTVPRKAIVRAGGYDGLFVVTPDNVARLVMVTTGGLRGEEIEILSGVEPGSRVAVAPLDKLAEGARVEVRR